MTRSESGALLLELGGTWRLGESMPGPALIQRQIDAEPTVVVRFDSHDVVSWSSALLAFAAEVIAVARAAGVDVDRSGLPEGVQRLLALGERPHTPPVSAPARRLSVLERIGTRVLRRRHMPHAMLATVGEQVLAVGRLVRGRAKFRGSELLMQMQATGANALGIVGLVAGLLGLIIAFISAAQLESLGASLYVANLVGIAMVRDLGALMTAVVVAGRTGAEFTAELGTMRVTQEIDALTTMGFSPVESVVLPRVLAVTLMMPLLCVFADVIGVLGGAVVGVGLMNIAPRMYVAQTLHAVSPSDLVNGLVKATIYGFLIGEASCYVGLRAGRSARGVGKAAASGVVASIVLVIAACAVYAFMTYEVGR
jgi:phospholipid/cholesterol/gamma-HCH transport system permease protein